MGGEKMYMPFGEIETPEFIKEFQEREKTALTDLKKNYKTTFLSFILRFKKVYSMTPIELKSNETQRTKDLRPIALTLLFRHCEDKEQIYKEMNPTKEELEMVEYVDTEKMELFYQYLLPEHINGIAVLVRQKELMSHYIAAE